MFASGYYLDKMIYAIGGVDKDKNEMDTCEVYDIRLNMWIDFPKLTSPKSSASLIVISEGYLYLFGAYPLSNSSIEAYYDGKKCWT